MAKPGAVIISTKADDANIQALSPRSMVLGGAVTWGLEAGVDSAASATGVSPVASCAPHVPAANKQSTSRLAEMPVVKVK
jgi:hypothetical protein